MTHRIIRARDVVISRAPEPPPLTTDQLALLRLEVALAQPDRVRGVKRPRPKDRNRVTVTGKKHPRTLKHRARCVVCRANAQERGW